MQHRNMIFVLGTGRSGTCWMGEILAQHPEIKGFVEPQPLFNLVTTVAVSPSRQAELLPEIFARYEGLNGQAAPLHMSDKSHPCIWIAERLAARFSNSRFIGVRRAVEPTVASMLRHKGVRRWCEKWHKYERPNRFLGITNENYGWYRQATLLQRCVARWYAHQQELTRLQKSLGKRLHVVDYDDMVKNPVEMLAALREFLKLNVEFHRIEPKLSSLGKWKSQLSDADQAAIAQAVELLSTTGGFGFEKRASRWSWLARGLSRAA